MVFCVQAVCTCTPAVVAYSHSPVAYTAIEHPSIKTGNWFLEVMLYKQVCDILILLMNMNNNLKLSFPITQYQIVQTINNLHSLY